LLHRRDEVATVAINVRKSHHQPRCTLKLLCEDSKSSIPVTIDVSHMCVWTFSHNDLDQCFSTAGPRPVPGPGINYTGPREALLEFVILVF